MHLELNFSLENTSLDKEYRTSIISYIKKAFDKINVLDEYYDDTPSSKSFTYSIYLPNPSFGGNGDNIVRLGESRMTLNVSTYNQLDGINLYNAFHALKGQPFSLPHDNSMTLHTIKNVSKQMILNDKIRIKFLSPLMVRRHEKGTADKYYITEDIDFSSAFEFCVQNQIKNEAAFAGVDTAVTLTPIKPKYTVVSCFGVKMRCSLGIYELQAHPVILNYLRDSGIGSRRNAGFGMFVTT